MLLAGGWFRAASVSDFGSVRTKLGEMTAKERSYLYLTDPVGSYIQVGGFGDAFTALNMSMLECFFSNRYAKRGDLFEGLSIWKEEKYRQLQGTFPVIFLTFANVKASKYKDMEYSITRVISDLYEKNRYLLDKDVLSDNEREYYNSIKPGMDRKLSVDAIHSIARFMQRYHEKDVIIILDEYDTPMHEAWINGYWDRAVGFFRQLFNSPFKSNPYLDRGMITGITSISKESIFSDLNNLNIITTTSDEYATAFGFTEREVFQVLDDVGLGTEKQEVKRWYDAYWANTSANGLINSLIRTGNSDLKQTMETLLQGKSFVTGLDEQIVYDQLDGDDNAVWSLLLAAGYLKTLNLEYVGMHKTKMYTLAVTNLETLGMFEAMVKGWFKGSVRIVYNEFIKAMLSDNVRMMNKKSGIDLFGHLS